MGLAPLLVKEIASTIRALRKRERTIVLVEQIGRHRAAARRPRLCAGERPRQALRTGAELARMPEVNGRILGAE